MKGEAHISSTPDQASSYGKHTGEFLKDPREEKLTTSVGADTQLLQCAKEDLTLNTKMIEKWKKQARSSTTTLQT